MDDPYIFCDYEIISSTNSVTFNTLLPVFNKMLYTSVVKFPVSTLDHVTKTLFQFVVICKTEPTYFIFTGPNRC
jgi:hypothetical protein